MLYLIVLQFFTQRAAVDAKIGSGFTLIIVAVPQHGLQQGLFDFGDYGFKQVAGSFSI